MAEQAAAAGVEVWAWVLMPSHVHLILAPYDADALWRALAPGQRFYAGHVLARLERSGYFWQGRFGCVATDEIHLSAALRHVALNPVRARLRRQAIDLPWSSVPAHLGREDGVTRVEPVLARYLDFARLIRSGEGADVSQKLRQAETIGRPLGTGALIARLERESGRALKPAKRGPRPRSRRN